MMIVIANDRGRSRWMHMRLVLGLVFFAACSNEPSPGAGMQLTNPASVHCGEVGGELRIESLGNSGEVGVCWFEDGRQCEEWALLRGECPVGGRRVTGFVTPGGRYCAIRGGSYQMTHAETATESERGRCRLPDGTVCEAAALVEGHCG